MKKITHIKKSKRHEDLKNFEFKGGLFDLSKVDIRELEKNIGRKMTFADRPYHGESHRETYEIREIQKIFNGDLAYRVYSLDRNDTFGRPAKLEDVIFLD